MHKKIIFIMGMITALFIIYSISAPRDLYSQQGLSPKGIKAFRDESAKADVPDPEAASLSQSVPRAKNYDVLLAEIEKIKKQNETLRKELEDTRAAKIPSGAKTPGRSAKRADASKGERPVLITKNKELEARFNESIAKARKDSSKLYFELGNVYTRSRLYKNAIDAYLLALESDPKCAEAHYNLGLLYQRYQGDTKKAAMHLKKYINSNPPPDRKKEAAYLLGMINSGREWVNVYY